MDERYGAARSQNIQDTHSGSSKPDWLLPY
jgi:hypothetical protein